MLRVKARGQPGLVTVVGHAAAVTPGEWITATGEWVRDRTHGPQFRARFLKASEPTSPRRHPQVPRLGAGPRHRTGIREEAGGGLRRHALRRDRLVSGAAAGGGRHRRGPGGADPRGVGGAAHGPRDHGLPARARGGDGPVGAHLQDLWGRRHRGDVEGSVPALARHPRHRLPDRRCAGDAARHREDGCHAAPGRRLARAGEGDGRGALRPAGGGAGPAGGWTCSRRRASWCGGQSRRGADGRHPDRRPGRRCAVPLPGLPPPRGARHRGASAEGGGGARGLGRRSIPTARSRGSSGGSASLWPPARPARCASR